MAVSTYELYKLPICSITNTLTTLTLFLYLVVGFVMCMHGRQILILCDLYIRMYQLPALDLDSEISFVPLLKSA
jgi:hypothetical protein